MQAFESLPRHLRQRVANVQILVQPRASRRQLRQASVAPGGTLLGLYQGVPLTRRGEGYHMTLPDRIFIFQEPHERGAADERALEERVRRTLLHEIAHYFGISDDRLTELDYD